MLVGPSGGGKTCTSKVLSHALTQLSLTKEYRKKYSKVNIITLNPKAVSMD